MRDWLLPAYKGKGTLTVLALPYFSEGQSPITWIVVHCSLSVEYKTKYLLENSTQRPVPNISYPKKNHIDDGSKKGQGQILYKIAKEGEKNIF